MRTPNKPPPKATATALAKAPAVRTTKPDQEWLFYFRASWAIDQAAYVANTLISELNANHPHPQRVMRDAAYRYCIVSYCSSFMRFRTKDGTQPGLSKEEVVPKELSAIHDEARNFRDKILAHVDIEHLSALRHNQGYGGTFSTTHIEAPSLTEAFKLFSTVSAVVIKKMASLQSPEDVLG